MTDIRQDRGGEPTLGETAAEALWECNDCGAQGIADGVVATQPNTPDGLGESEFYAERDRGGCFFAGCLYCGSEDVGFDDVRPLGRPEPRDPVRESVERRTGAFKKHQRETGKGLPV